MKKKYLYEGAFWLFEEGRQPAGAVEVAEEKAEQKEKSAEPPNKAVKPANKAKAVKKK